MTTQQIKGEAISNLIEGFSSSIVRSISYGDVGLVVEIENAQTDSPSALLVSFQSVYGFRVLDEGDLNDFWEADFAGVGFIYKITQGGWLDQELRRPGFIGAYSDFASEYLVTSDSMCVNVIAGQTPIITSKC